MRRRSIKDVASKAVADDEAVRHALAEALKHRGKNTEATRDSYQNFAAQMGVGADTLLSSSNYGFNPITRNRTLLEWIYRGSWIGGVAVDCVADDMTREGLDYTHLNDPHDAEVLNNALVHRGIWDSINEGVKWGRLYGGAIGVMLVDGQKPDTPLRLETVGPGQFMGLMILDRWMCDPYLQDLVTEYGPHLGLPRFYNVTADSPALPRMRIHYSRVIRFEGVRLPYWQRIAENMWGLSVIERLYDRMIAFDSATTGAAQLVFKSYLRTYKIKDLREIVAAGGAALNGLMNYVDIMRRFQTIEGMTMLDTEDEFEATGHSAFSGLGEALIQFGQQLSGALQIPLVRLFGQSPSGLNSSGESDLRTYYDGIGQQQERTLRTPMHTILKMMAQSEKVELSDDFGFKFKSLWKLSDAEKATVAGTVTTAVTAAEGAGIIGRKTALSELRASSSVTGVFSSITDKDIEEAENDPPPASEMMGEDGEPVDPGEDGEEPEAAAGASENLGIEDELPAETEEGAGDE